MVWVQVAEGEKPISCVSGGGALLTFKSVMWKGKSNGAAHHLFSKPLKS